MARGLTIAEGPQNALSHLKSSQCTQNAQAISK